MIQEVIQTMRLYGSLHQIMDFNPVQSLLLITNVRDFLKFMLQVVFLCVYCT